MLGAFFDVYLFGTNKSCFLFCLPSVSVLGGAKNAVNQVIVFLGEAKNAINQVIVFLGEAQNAVTPFSLLLLAKCELRNMMDQQA